MSWRFAGEDLLLDCHLQPGARQTACAGMHGERLKIRIHAPPLDGRANAELLAFLADAFGVAKSQVILESGASSRSKRVRVCRPVLFPSWPGMPEIARPTGRI
ncbi:TPA: DUF167 family protein [Klebsiella pneumoniae]